MKTEQENNFLAFSFLPNYVRWHFCKITENCRSFLHLRIKSQIGYLVLLVLKFRKQIQKMEIKTKYEFLEKVPNRVPSVFVLFYTHTNRYNSSLSQILWQLQFISNPMLTGKVQCITLPFKSLLCKWSELYIVWRRPSPLPEIHKQKYACLEVEMLESKLHFN